MTESKLPGKPGDYINFDSRLLGFHHVCKACGRAQPYKIMPNRESGSTWIRWGYSCPCGNQEMWGFDFQDGSWISSEGPPAENQL